MALRFTKPTSVITLVLLNILFPVDSQADSIFNLKTHNLETDLGNAYRTFNDLGYVRVFIDGFDNTRHAAVVVLSKNPNSKAPYEFIYNATIIGNGPDAHVEFKNYVSCKQTGLKPLDTIFFVNEQKLSAEYSCSMTGDRDHPSIEVWVPKTLQARKFINDSFNKGILVNVKFENVNVPFKPTGFIELLKEAAKPAL